MVMPVPARPSNPLRPSGARPVRAARAPVASYTTRVTVPITGGQARGVIPASGALALAVGPSGLGTVWYPASAVISSSMGTSDPSSCSVYAGATADPAALQGTLEFQGGGGVVSMAVPQVTPGMAITAVWSGATPGTTVTLNVTGTASVLTAP